MDIKQLAIHKTNMEVVLLQAIQDFEDRTGMIVDSITLHRGDLLNEMYGRTVAVETEMKLTVEIMAKLADR